IGLRLEPAPVGAQRLQQRRAQGQVAVLVELAVDHVDDHALAVNVVDLQASNLGAAHARAIKDHQKSTLEQVVAGVDQPGHFFRSEDHALAVNVVDLQASNLGAAHARAIKDHQKSTLEQVVAGVDQPGHFF